MARDKRYVSGFEEGPLLAYSISEVLDPQERVKAWWWRGPAGSGGPFPTAAAAAQSMIQAKEQKEATGAEVQN